MNGATMGDAVWTAVKAASPAPGTDMTDAQGKAIWVAACTAIIAHIAANATVNVPVNGTVTSGAGAGGSVTGTAVQSSGGVT